MKYLITGGCGFVGSNLATEVLKRGETLIILDNLFRHGSEKNLAWLNNQGSFDFYHADIRNYTDVEYVLQQVRPDVIFHLAGQVAMTTSLRNPRLDFEINSLGTHNILEIVRKHMPETPIFYSSTNKVYGDFKHLSFEETESRYVCKEYPNGFDESFPIDFHSPYACSKGSADQYLLDYHRMFNLKTVVFRHSSMYGTNQYATYDQGWIGWFCQKAVEIKIGREKRPFMISGSGKQVRDVLFAADVVKLYFTMFENIENVKGEVFNIGGGMKNSMSLIELFAFLEKELNIQMNYEKTDWRQSDQKIFIANYQKAKMMTGWEPAVDKYSGIRNVLQWIQEEKKEGGAD
jgi:CDP-paratose 2-epimerase